MSNSTTRILIVIPNRDFDTTEVAIPWRIFKENGFSVDFATADGARGYTDPLLLTGVLFGQLGASVEAIQAYRRLEADSAFVRPFSYAQIAVPDYAAVVIPGGHAKGMVPFLENKILQDKILAFWRADKTVAAICHGPIVLART
ncbi:MAG: type 1 glutamine amidotransferase domain-containing protein, partial [Gorillibacterium sp.]|nr:type 1 glutamine amidotransferase domain-containing protein [Gorillibacterium sp.]